MRPSSGSRLIQLLSVRKSFPAKRGAPEVVLRPTTISLPADCRVAVLADRRQGKTSLLRLLAGAELPDAGDVIAPLRRSPVINSGNLCDPQLTISENIRFYARVFAFDADRLILAVDAFCGSGALLGRLGKRLREPGFHRLVELALASVLPFDCYLVDDIGRLAADTVDRFFAAAAQRGCGVIFATGRPRLARQFGDCAVVIRDQILHPFSRVEEATRFYEQ